MERIMLPQLFKIPFIDVPIHTYGVMIVIGFLLAIYIAYRQCLQIGKYADDVLDFGFWALVGGMLGARIVFIMVEWRSFFIDHPFVELGHSGVKIPSVFAIWQGGLVYFGSIIGGFIAYLIFAKKRSLPTLHVADILVLGVPLAQMFGRLGCIAAGCCWGGNVGANWPIALQFPPGSSAFASLWESASPEVRSYMQQMGHTMPLFPSQLAEAFGTALLFFVLYFIARHKRFHGQVLLSYAVLYSILRSILEIFRGDVGRGFVIEGILSTSQFISLVVVLASLIAMWWIHRKSKEHVSSPPY